MMLVRTFGVASFVSAVGCYHAASYPRTPAGGVEPARAYTSHESAVRRRFAADSQCDKDKITIEEMGAGVFLADGCGKHEFYQCEGMGEPRCSVHAPKK